MSEVTVKDLVLAQQFHLAKLQNKLSARQHRIVRAAIEDVSAKIGSRKVVDRWTDARLRSTLAMLSRGFVQLVGRQKNALTKDLKLVTRRSQLDAIHYLETLDNHFHGSVQPLAFESLEWWKDTNRDIGTTRLKQYSKSWNRYGATVVGKIQDAIGQSILVGEPWHAARSKVMEITKDTLNGERWMVDRIIRTESSAAWNGTQLLALQSETSPDDPMSKKLVAHFDGVTGRDSVKLHGQTRPVKEPFYDAHHGKSYQAPPNRPNDREQIVGWRKSYGEDFDDFDHETAVGHDPELHGEMPGEKGDSPDQMTDVVRRRATKREQIDNMRAKRNLVANQIGVTRESMDSLTRQLEVMGAAAPEHLREALLTKSGMLSILRKDLEDNRRWIDMLRLKV